MRLRAAGFENVVSVEPSDEGMAALSGIARRGSGETVFAKSYEVAPGDDVFTCEAEGLEVLRRRGGLSTPDVLHASADVLVLSMLRPRPDDELFWERAAHAVAHLHGSTVNERYGWERDNWLGPMRQHNAWQTDGFAFFAEQRVLRWLPERRVRAKLGPDDVVALERLCARLPELLPPMPACLTHGDLWSQNILATADGGPAFIDPAVSFAWADVDVSHLWCSPHPPAAQRFFDVYGELMHRDMGWLDRLPLVHLRQQLALMAMFDDDWGATRAVQALVAPFRTRR